MLTDGVVTLRKITAGDIAVLFTWRNEAGTRPMFRDDRLLDFESHDGFVRRHLEDAHSDYWWMVEASGAPVGTICLFHFSPDGRECEFGRFIVSSAHRGCGYGRRALVVAMDFARSLGVERIACVALSSNQRAVQLYRSLGFAVKGSDGEDPRRFVLMEAGLTGR